MTPHPTPADEHLVIIGNGMAGHRLVEALMKRPDRPRRITVIGEEATPAYNRILLSPWLAGEMDREALTLHDADWYADQGIELLLGARIAEIDRRQQRLVTAAGRQIGYDRLVLATGSRPALPAVEGIDLDGVHGFRDLEDVATLTRAARRGGPAVVIGGGLLGLEAAEGLRKQAKLEATGDPAATGRDTTISVLQRSARLMNRQLDATAAGLLEAELTERGLAILTGARLAALEDDTQGRVCAVHLEDGRRLAAHCVVIAAGITPNTGLGEAAGLEVKRAIVVDEFLTTSDPRIHALGECCQFNDTTYGLVEPIWRQVEVLADHLSRTAKAQAGAGYVEQPTATKLKISGIALYAFGPIEPDDDHEVLTYHDPQHGDYRRLLLRNNRLEGAVLYGDTAAGPWYFEQSLDGQDLSGCRQALLFGASDANRLLDSASSPTATQEAAA